MFDAFAQDIFEALPALEGLTPENARRALSRAYLAVVRIRAQGLAGIPEDINDDILFLRRLANALESRAVLDIQVGDKEKRSAAFAAAEALSLLADLRELIGFTTNVASRIEREEVFARIEAALLYFIAGYDANAGGVIKNIPNTAPEPEGTTYKQVQSLASEWALDVLIAFCALRLNPMPLAGCPVTFPPTEPQSLIDLEYDVRGRLYARLGEAVRAYMAWLSGELPDGLEFSRNWVSWIADRLAETQHFRNADIHHLARLLLAVFDRTQERSLVHSVPPPDDVGSHEYRLYLSDRAKGPPDPDRNGRPLLWPSTKKYVDACLPGPHQHAVISMPTGSGKGFLAELAVSQSAQRGWALYLVPTNALAHQVRRDLGRALSSLEVDVWAFIGHSEYTTLEGERVGQVPPGTVVVMTPEKCSLAMRLNPEAFHTCRLCVFDECHLIANRSRGIIAELTISQLMVLAPECRFLLMSAIVQNPEDLAEWLDEATGSESSPVGLTWRPTRTLRCVAGVDDGYFNPGFQAARKRLEEMSDFRKNESFEVEYSLLAGLQGAWQTSDQVDYAITVLPVKAALRVTRKKSHTDEWRYGWGEKSWVNESCRRLGQMLAEVGIPTLVFLPADKRYPFVVGGKMVLSESAQQSLPEHSDRVRAFITLANDELGVESEVGNLLSRGLAVHTAALVETEKFASEEAFRNGSARVILATGTLAQGLNLPAIAVVIGGTRIGYSRGEKSEVVERRKLAQLLNASGRAGRAGFANQGIVIAVPDKPPLIRGPETADDIRDEISYLCQPDSAVRIGSLLEEFMDSIATGTFDSSLATQDELVAMAVLAGGSPKAPPADEVLRRTYAAFLRRRKGLADGAEIGAYRLDEVRNDFTLRAGVPDWLPMAAQRAGLDFFLTLRLFQAWKRAMPQLPDEILNWDTWQWLDLFFEALSYLPPKRIIDVFGLDDQRNRRFMPGIYNLAHQYPSVRQDDPQWTVPDGWQSEWESLKALVRLWMEGQTLSTIASVLLDVSDEISAQRTGNAPIPKTLAFVNIVIGQRFAILAGGMVAIVESSFQSLAATGQQRWSGPLPLALSSLPLAIKYGCDSPQTLAWYRFGIRFRRPAHLLAQAFPIDQELYDDTLLRASVQSLLHNWLADQIGIPDKLAKVHGHTFDSLKVILKSESS